MTFLLTATAALGSKPARPTVRRCMHVGEHGLCGAVLSAYNASPGQKPRCAVHMPPSPRGYCQKSHKLRPEPK